MASSHHIFYSRISGEEKEDSLTDRLDGLKKRTKQLSQNKRIPIGIFQKLCDINIFVF